MAAKRAEAAEASDLPVGTVLPYAGVLPASLAGKGWLICDGRVLRRSEFPDLFGALGTANGEPDQETFNVPDCRGYFLRGVDHAGVRDPAPKDRVAPRTGANSGDRPGSIQVFATQRPNTNFQADVPHLPDDSHGAYYGTNTDVSQKNDGSRTFEVAKGGDQETRPVNKYVFFIVKSRRLDGNNQPVRIPAGAVVAFAGTDPSALQQAFVLCNGDLVNNAGVYRELFGAVEFAHGGNGADMFNLPDYRGYFLRGVADGQFTDPDRAGRTAARAGGNSGDKVGSQQGWATARPRAALKTSFPNLPSSKYTSDNVAGPDSALWNGGSTEVDLTQFNGDAETRPMNVSVDWYVKFKP